MRQAKNIFETNPTQGITKENLYVIVPRTFYRVVFKGVSGW